jgi:hypothetical protein
MLEIPENSPESKMTIVEIGIETETETEIVTAVESAANLERGTGGREADPSVGNAPVLRHGVLLMKTITAQVKHAPENAAAPVLGTIEIDEIRAVPRTAGREVGPVAGNPVKHAPEMTGIDVIVLIVKRDLVPLVFAQKEKTGAGLVCALSSDSVVPPPGERAARSEINPVIVQIDLVTAAVSHRLALLLPQNRMSLKSGRLARSRSVSRKPRPI